MARELINRIQNIRKETGLEITDRIDIRITDAEAIAKAVGCFADYIKAQVLADNIVLADNDGQEVELDELKANIKIEKR